MTGLKRKIYCCVTDLHTGSRRKRRKETSCCNAILSQCIKHRFSSLIQEKKTVRSFSQEFHTVLT